MTSISHIPCYYGNSVVLEAKVRPGSKQHLEELKTSVVEDKPLIHTVEENNNEPHYHNVSGKKLFEGSRIVDLLFVIKQLKDGCTVLSSAEPLILASSGTAWRIEHQRASLC